MKRNKKEGIVITNPITSAAMFGFEKNVVKANV